MENVYFYTLVKVMKYQVFWRYQVSMCMLSHSSHARLFVTPWTLARQSLLTMGFSGQEYQSGHCSSPVGSSQPRDWTWVSEFFCTGREPESLSSSAPAGNLSVWVLLHRQGTWVSEFLTTSTTWEALMLVYSVS